MKHLLDVSTLIALLWPSHQNHQHANAWRTGKKLVLCPITELGFIRVSTSAVYNASIEDARKTLSDFIRDERPDFVPCDLRVLDGQPAPSSGKTTDWYLAELADKHGMKWATLDTRANHPAAVVVV